MGVDPVILEAAMIAPQLFLYPCDRLIGAEIGINGLAFGTHGDLGIEMNDTLGAEAVSVLRQGDVAGITSVEVLIHGFRDPDIDAITQRFTDIEIFA
jgi:hypothetical protein